MSQSKTGASESKPRRRLLVRLARLVLVAVLAVAALTLLLVRMFESKLIYFPTPYPGGNGGLPSGAQDVTFTTSDGVRLHAWWMPAKDARLTLLFAHGNGGNITTRRDVAIGLRKLGMNVLLFDYRGYGRSEGSPSESGLYLDAEAALAFLKEKGIPSQRVVLFGESLGTAVVAEMAVRHKAAAIILESPFTNIPDMARLIVPIPMGWALSHRFDTLRKAPRFQSPLLVIHGTDDDLVPYEFGQRVFQSAPQPKRFFGVGGAHHNDVVETAGPRFTNEIQAFLDSIGEHP
ncbi:MAG: alpha/beta hydrolase [Fimbriimonadaceae bacterium]|nr:alpha/beta hydrolase [Chthonomonadaceae bacterium]MCO5296139.1 alpha/beta hydrolase [Fimbriimonadaceae bacterium]